QLVKFQYSFVGTFLHVWATTPGTGGNALTLTSTAGTASGGTLSGASGTDISGLMVCTDASGNGAYVADGVDAETPVECVALFDSLFGQQWYAVMIPDATNDQALEVAAYIEG